MNAEALRKLDVKPLDVARVRGDFPILNREVYGNPLVYLDNAASAQKPRSVLAAMDKAFTEDYANVHRGLHYLSNRATELYEEARGKVRAFVNARDAAEIIFTSGATDAINLVAASWGRTHVAKGDEIILSEMEHHSNIVPWHMLCAETGARLRWAPISDDGEFLLTEYEKLLSPRTKLVAITHMSNVLGTVVPIAEVAKRAHAVGAKVLVDGAQGAVHLPVDVQALECDFYAFTGHKLYGPNGIGVLYGRRDLLEEMPPYRGGGEMIEEVHQDRVTFARSPMRFEAGTPPIVPAIGLGAAIDYVTSLGRDAIRAHEQDLLSYANGRLRAFNWLRLLGTAPDKGSIVAFTVEGAHAHDVATIIDREGVAVRAGHHCAQPLMERFGLTSTCRASFALYNTRAEVDRLAEALEKAREFLA